MAAGSIIWELLMKTASFTTDTKRAEKQLKALKKEAEAMGKAFGAVIAAGAAAATYALKESINAMDEASKAAQKVGVTTESFTALAHAANLADLDTAELTKGLTKLGVEASTGNKAFDAMGINVRDAAGNLKSADVILGEVAGKFASYRDGAEKTALAVALFGEKIGPKLIPLLNGGAVGLKEMTDEARALGLVISTETGKAAEDFNDNLTRLWASVRGVSNEIAAELLPTLNRATENFLLARKSGIGFWQALTGIGLRGVTENLEDLTQSAGTHVKELNKNIDELVARQERVKQAAASANDGSGDFLAALSKSLDADIKAEKSKRAYFEGIVASNIKLASYSNEGRRTAAMVAPTVSDGKAEAAAEKARLAALKKAAQEAQRARKELEDEGRRMMEAVQTPSEKLTSAQGNVKRLAGAGVIDPETQKRALTEAHDVYDKYVKTQRDMLVTGLLTEEQEIQASYERRRQMILALTEATEAEKANSIAALTDSRDSDINLLHYQRYADLLSEEERLTKEYNDRKRKIEDDESLSAEYRYGYLTTLSEQYHARMQELDEEDQKKKDELHQKQIDMVSAGFANVAEVTKAFAGEQSAEYQAMFAASKAFALADLTIKQSQAIADAWAKNNYWVAIGITAGLVGQFASLISSVSGASFGGARADGGPVNAGRSYLVGERGPEMFAPNEGGRIIPNDAIRSDSSAQSVRIVNAYDTEHVSDFMGSDSGARTIMNVIRRNGATIRALNAG